MAATASDVLAFGSNLNGQLGLGEHGPCVSAVPLPIPGLRGMAVVQLACGASHTMCVTAQSQVWGSVKGGRGRQASGWYSFQGVVVKGCAAPLQTIVLNRSSESTHATPPCALTQVFAWGANSVGQLGLGDRRDRWSPTLVDALWALPVVQVGASVNRLVC